MTEPAEAAAASAAGEASGAGPAATSADIAAAKTIPEAPAAASESALLRIFRLLSSWARFEDWLLAFFVVFAAPLIVHTGRSTGGDLFGPGDPVQGTLRLGAVLAALVCAAARVRDLPRAASRSFFSTAAVGPFTGAVLLVGASGASALSLPGAAVEIYAAAAVVLMVLARFALPPQSPVVRRALVTPFILVAGGLFWTAIDAVFAGPLVSGGAGSLTVATLQSLMTSPAFLFLLAFSGVYYAMLVYAPRQVADPEGGALAWAIRYAMFLTGVALGVGWLSTVGG